MEQSIAATGIGAIGLAEKRILYLASSPTSEDELKELQRIGHVVVVATPDEAAQCLCSQQFDRVIIASGRSPEAFPLEQLFQAQFLISCLPDGVVLLDRNNTILWANDHFRCWCSEEPVGRNFYRALGSPEIVGPDYCPLHTALSTRGMSHSVLRTSRGSYYRIHTMALSRDNSPPRHLVVTVRDVTEEVLQQQKMEAIHRAGIDLADLKPEHLPMSVQDRIELLKSKIVHYTQDLLHYDTVEIRLLDRSTGRLEQLLSVGMEPEAADRVLYAKAEGNGVTGFVAATGKSYLCGNTECDPLYLPGAKGAKSSMTVPLVLHEEVIGTFNVESPQPDAFDESDMQFLEIFSRDVAMALNTLELLAAEKASTAQRQTEATFSAVALPIDEILNDAVTVIEQYIGHDPEVVRRLQRIAANAREIKAVIQKVGEEMTTQVPARVHNWKPPNPHPELRGRQVLVADADDAVRSAAHQLLERYGCVVETARGGQEALRMVRNLSGSRGYDCIIADIRLPDMNGYELMLALREIIDPVPLVLMTGFGYDPSHSIVRARQAGLKAVLYKPFRVQQLLETVGRMVLRHQPSQVSG